MYDLDPHEALHAATRIRRGAGKPLHDLEEVKEAVSLVGGRLSYLNKVSVSLSNSGTSEVETSSIIAGGKSKGYNIYVKAFVGSREGVVAQSNWYISPFLS